MHDRRLKKLIGIIDFQVAIKTAIAGSLGWGLGISISHFFDRPDTLISGLWCTVTAIVVLQARLGGTYKAAWVRFLGVLIGSLFGALATRFFGSHPLSLAVSLFITIIICSLLNIKDSIRIACMSVAVVMVLQGFRPEVSPWTFALFRFLDSCLGIMVAMLVAHSVWPFQATEKLRLNMVQISTLLNQLYQMALFSTQPADDKLVLNIRMQIESLLQQNEAILEEAQIELITEPQQVERLRTLQRLLRRFLEILLSLEKIGKMPQKLFDPALQAITTKMIDQINHSFNQLTNYFITNEESPQFAQLFEMQHLLSDDLARFRSTKATRQFPLNEVESFFVFFFSISELTRNFQAIQEE